MSNKIIDIFNVNVYGLEESIIRSGYPMQTEVKIMDIYVNELEEKDLKRAVGLGNAKTGSGHQCYLKGIHVQCDISAPQYWWLQMERYHFWDTISSQSTMHRITKMDINEQVNKWVDQRVIDVVNEYIDKYNSIKSKSSTEAKDLFQQIISNTPEGLMLTKGIYTNYLQLQTICNQRKGHKLLEWEVFIDWCTRLPMFNVICMGLEE